MSAHEPQEEGENMNEDEDDMLNPDDIGEEIAEDEDMPMDSDEEDGIVEEIQLQNDSVAHFLSLIHI